MYLKCRYTLSLIILQMLYIKKNNLENLNMHFQINQRVCLFFIILIHIKQLL